MDSARFELTDAPYPGLRPFRADESDIFFGRERQTDELLARLRTHRFLAVVGPSGCGKSSLVAAGLLPALDAGFMVGAGSHWRVAYLRPGARPMQSLVEALLAAEILPPERAARSDAKAFLAAALRRGPLGLVEIVRGAALEPDANLLVLVDQFEELFRYSSGAAADEADAFVSLLLASAGAAGQRIYVAITMRSDFLGECAVFHGLPEAINDGLYLTPRLTRDECGACITGPARVFGADVNPALVNRLLNDFGPDPDQLPLLQHALLRMWNRHEQDRAAGVKTILSAADYEAIGGLARSLSDHADEALAELNAAEQRVAELMFRRLSDSETAKRDRRTPARVSEIAALAGVEVADVIRVADVFRRRGRCFLTPREDVPLDADTTLDVSHESLLRQWRKAASWIEEEAEAVTFYRRLKQAAQEWKGEGAALWGKPNLDRGLAWRDRLRPTPAWAARYAARAELAKEELGTVLAFLDASEKERQAKKAQEHRRRTRRARIVSATAAGILAMAILTVVAHRVLYVWEQASCYKSFVMVRGAPRGVGELTAKQVRHRPLSYLIVTAGLLGPAKRMYAVNSRGAGADDPRPDQLAEVEPEYTDPRGSQLKSSIWYYEYDRRGLITSEFEYTRHGELVHGHVYVPVKSGEPRVRKVYFIDSLGTPIPARRGARSESSAPFWAQEVHYSDKGLQELVSYLGFSGEPVPGNDRAFKVRYEYDGQDRVVAQTSLDRDGKPMNDTAGNSTMRVEYDERGDVAKEFALDADGRPTKVINGFAVVRFEYDDFGNETARAYFDENENPVAARDGWHRITYKRDEQGNVVEEYFFDQNNRSTIGSKQDACHGFRERHDEAGRLLQGTCISADGAPAKSRGGFVSWTRRYDERGRLVEQTYLDAEGKLTAIANGYASVRWTYDELGRNIETSYHGIDGAPIMTKQGYAVLKTDYDDAGRIERSSFFGYGGVPVRAEKGHASVTRRRDTSWNIVEELYFDERGSPMTIAVGNAGFRQDFNARGQPTETIFVGRGGELVLDRRGVAGWRQEFDDLGRGTITRYIGLLKEPTVSTDSGVAGWSSRYDTWGRVVERGYFGEDGKPTNSFQGEAGWRAEYDPLGNEIERSYIDMNGALTLRAWEDDQRFTGRGHARLKQAYDARGNLIEQSYFGVSNEPVARPEGWSRVVHEYDDLGHQIRTAYFGAKGEPIKVGGGGYHAMLRKYDDRGNIEEVTYLDTDLKTPVASADGFARMVMAYDRYGNRIEESYFDADGSRGTLKNGSHHVVITRDEHGWIVRIDRFGPEDPPNQLQSTAFRHDERGNVTEERYLDPKGNPFAKDGPCAIRQRRWSERKELLEEKCLDAGEALAPGLAYGAARIEYRYDQSGKRTEEKYHDTSDLPFTNSYGHAGRRYSYDRLGREIEVAYVDDKGNLAPTGKVGHSRVKSTYDQIGNLAVQEYFDSNNKPTRPVARMEMEYDSMHRKVRDRYFGPGGEHALLSGTGQHETVYEYNDFGVLEALRYLDAQGRPTRGYARSDERVLDDKWQLCYRWVASYGPDGELVGNGVCEQEPPSK